MPMEDEVSTRKGAKIPLRAKALMAVVAVVTLLAVWLVPDDKQPTPPPLPELPGAPQVDVDLPPPAPPAEDGAAAIPAGDRARAFVSSLRSGGTEPDPETVFVEAERLQGEGYSDDAYLLYRFAARHGHGQAALVLGTQADPAFHAAANPDSLNDEPEQAYKWYSMAVAAGIEEAAARLQDLRKRVEQSAAAGDERAQRLMLQWQ
jgi:TPR repeat protein